MSRDLDKLNHEIIDNITLENNRAQNGNSLLLLAKDIEEHKAIRVGISVFLAVAVSKLLHLKYPFFVALPVVTSISASVIETVKSSRNRILGTLIGAAAGVLLALIQPSSAILSGVGMVAIIYACNFIHFREAAAIAGLVFIAIMVSVKRGELFSYGFNRITDTLIGVIITIIVNNILFHNHYLGIIDTNCKNIYIKLFNLIKDKIILGKQIDLSILKQEIQYVDNQLEIYDEDYNLSRHKRTKTNEYRKIIDILISTYDHLKIICFLEGDPIINESNMLKLKSIYDFESKHGAYINNDINTVYNFHLGKLLYSIVCLDEILKDKT